MEPEQEPAETPDEEPELEPAESPCLARLRERNRVLNARRVYFRHHH